MILGYLDPGTGSLIIQTVLGGVAGLAVFWKSTRRRFADGKTPVQATSTEETPELAKQENES